MKTKIIPSTASLAGARPTAGSDSLLCPTGFTSLPSAAYPSACSAKAQTHSQAQTQVQAQTHRFPKYFLKRVSVSLFLLCIGFQFKKEKKIGVFIAL